MLFDPTERDVNPFLIRMGIRTMTELVLALAIHDKDIIMAKPARVTLIARTGLTPSTLKSAWSCQNSLKQ